MSYLSTSRLYAVLFAILASISGCSGVPTSGPSRAQIAKAQQAADVTGIQIVDVTQDIARQLRLERDGADFSKVFGDSLDFERRLGVGDFVSISIWEAPPATLFIGSAELNHGDGLSGAPVTTLPEQSIDGNGDVTVPFLGAVKASGLTPRQLERDIAQRLKNMAHRPQVLVKLSRNETSYATVMGDVEHGLRMQLSARGERVLDALASAGGVRESVDKVTIQLARGSKTSSLALQNIISDPRQNVVLHPGDVVTALFQPYSFVSLGATGTNKEINFEAQGITLAQALARAGGLQDARSDAQGVFVFRLEDANALKWPNQPIRTTADGKVPVIYRMNLRDPNAFFVSQSFMMDNKDLLYVSNAPVTEIQKVLNLVFSVVYPVVSGVQTFK